jgi:RNA polymerase-binding transcription factor
MKRSDPRDAAGLTGTERIKLKLDLERERAVVLGELRSGEGAARAAESFAEPMDAAELSREQGDGAITVGRMRTHLRDIEDALAKIESGRYGLSEKSGRPIGYDRLVALPWARFAIDEE